MSAEEVLTTPRARERRWWRVALLGAAAVVLGVYADLGQHAAGFWGRLPELGSPWVLLAFAGGRTVRRPAAAAASIGFLLIVVGLATYGLFVHAAYGTQLRNVVLGGGAFYWGAVAAVLGPAAGVAGAGSTARRRATLRAAAWGFAVAVPLVEYGRISASAYLDLRGVVIALVALSGITALTAMREVHLLPLLAFTGVWTGMGYAIRWFV